MRLAPAAAFSLLAVAACSEEPMAPNPPPRNQMGPPADFTATGEMPCSAGIPAYDQSCVFGITRGAGGAAALQVENPAATPEGIQRVLLLQNNVWTTLDGSIAETERDAEATRIIVDDTEFYAVPHEVLAGT